MEDRSDKLSKLYIIGSAIVAILSITLAVSEIMDIFPPKTTKTPISAVTASLTSTVIEITPIPESAPLLKLPEDLAAFGPNDTIRFEWTWSGELQARDFFTVRLWAEGEPPQTYSFLKKNELIVDMKQRLGGTYFWNIAVVRLTKDQTWTIVSNESETRQFLWLTTSFPTPPIPSATDHHQMLPTSTPPSTATRTPTPTFTSQPRFTETPTATSTPSPIPTCSATPLPTLTPTFTPSPTPTATPTPTFTFTPTPVPSLMPAPNLLEPQNGVAFCPGESFTLKWVWDSRPFQPNEYYAVRIWKNAPGSDKRDVHWEQDFYLTNYFVKLQDRQSYYEGPGIYFWNIAVVFDRGRMDNQGNKVAKLVSEESAIWKFVVLSQEQPKCSPPLPPLQ